MFYGKEAVKTSTIAQQLIAAFEGDHIDIIPVEEATPKDFEKYANIIVGASTWFDGELPTYWDETLPEVNSSNLKGKHVAIFGLGDQVNYPENFLDGVGLLAEAFEAAGATIVGLTDPAGFHFERSRALRNGQLLGLGIDIENQPDQTTQRINAWVKQLKKDFAH